MTSTELADRGGAETSGARADLADHIGWTDAVERAVRGLFTAL